MTMMQVLNKNHFEVVQYLLMELKKRKKFSQCNGTHLSSMIDIKDWNIGQITHVDSSSFLKVASLILKFHCHDRDFAKNIPPLS